MVGEGGGLVVVCTVGLGVLVLLALVEQVGCPGGVAVGSACEPVGRHSLPVPGGGEGAVLAGGRLRHRCLRLQLEHLRPAALHSQRVRTLALHFASLVQLQHYAKVSL